MPFTKDKNKTKTQFADELKKLRERIAELEESQKRSKDIEKIITIQRNLALKLNETHDLEKGLQLCLEAAIKASGMDCGGVYLVDDTSGDFHLNFHTNLPSYFVKSVSCFDSKSAQAKFVMTGKSAYTRHLELDVPLKKAELSESLRAIAIIPIKHKKKVIACLNVASHTLDEVPVYSRTSLETIAGQMGGAIAHLKTEESLKDSEIKWASLTHNTKDILLIVDQKGIVQYINKTFPPYTIDETIGTDVYKYLPKEQHNIMSESLKKVFRTGKSDSFEVSPDIPEIEIKWFNTRVVPIKTEGKTSSAILITSDITEQKKAEEALKENEEKLKIAMNSADEGMWQWDFTTDQAYFDSACLKMLGYKPGEIQEKAAWWWTQWHPDDRARVQKAVNNYLKGHAKKYSVEFRVKNKSGQYIWISSNGVVLRKDKNGKPLYMIGIHQDITEHKKAEQELHSSEEKFRTLVNSSNDMIAINLVDENGPVKIIEVNDGMIRMLGYSKEELIGKHPFEFLEPMDQDEINRIMKNLHKKGQATFETTFISKDGKRIPIEMNSRMVKLQDKHIEIGIGRDLTERKKAEDALTKSEEMLRSILDSSPDAITVTDLTGKIIECNPATLQIHGYSRKKELLGCVAFNLIAPKDHKKAEMNLRKTLKKGFIKNINYTLLRKNGQEFPGELSASVIKDPDGNPISFVVITKDITEPKKAEEELHNSEEKYRGLFEQAPIGIGISTPEGKVVSGNTKMAEITGYSNEELMKIDLASTYENSEDRKNLLDMLKRDGSVDNFPARLKRKDGTIYDAELSISKICISGQDLLQTMCIDVTERKKIEEELKQSEEKYRTSFDNSHDAINVFNKDRRIVDVNKSLIQLSGYSEDKLLSMELKDLYPEAASPQSAERIRTLLEEKEVPIFETYLLTEKGTKIPVDIGITLLKNCYGEEFVFQGNIREIIERKKAEKKLKDSEKRYRLLLESLSDSVYVLDREWRHIIVNEAAEKFVKIPKEKLIGSKLTELFPGVEETPFFKVFKKVMKTRKPDTVTNEYEFEDGRKNYYEVYVYPVPEGILCISRDITEKKKTEEVIKEERNQLINILDSMQDGVYIMNQEYEIQYSNPAFHRESDSPIGKKCYHYINNKMKVCPWCKSKDVFAGKTVQWEFHSDIVDKTYDVIETPLKNPDGSISKLTIFRDITERKQTTRKIKESQERLSAIFEHVQTGVLIIDEETHEITDINPAAEKMVGIEKDKIIGKVCHEFLCPAEKGKCPISDLGQTVDNSERVLLCGKKSKEVPILKTVASMILDGHKYLIESFVDLTEKKKAEEELKESEEKYRLIFEHANDAIVQIDRGGKIINVNKKIKDISGYTPEEIIGKNFSTLAPLKLADMPKLLKLFKEMVTGKNKLDLLELKVQDKNDREIFIEVSPNKIEKNGKFDSILSIIRDITERKRAEKEKEELESQLRQVEKMEAIGQLAGGIAHDFNNQLGSIVGFADMIRERVMDDAKLCRYADNILITAKRSADITRQLLAFARKGKYQSTKVDIHNIIHEIISLLKHSIHKKIIIKQRLNANPSTTMGDPSQLQNAILNIAINACDAMPRGGEITLKTDAVFLDKDYCQSLQYNLPQGDYLQIGITDTGSGMDSETIQHIFEPFFTTKEVGKGTGMGLAAAYGSIKNHNGAINVSSEPGRGTTFTVHLPLTMEDTGEETDTFGKSDFVKGAAHILLADDEEMLCEMAKDMLETLGYKITVCRNGKEAMEVYKKSWKDIDLVILDLIMPEMDGKDAFLAMKKINPDIKVLLSSGYSITGTARELLSKGLNDFIQKPYRKAELSQKVAKVLGSDK